MVSDKELLHKEILDSMHEIYVKKNKDYGDSFHKSFVKRGVLPCFIRIEDKMNRLDNLIDNEKMVKDETMEDTLIDLANYAIMLCMELKLERKSKGGNND